ncbi:MAG: hypothetical protein VXZ72_04095, partial [Chlamydiota bacterium]|nr:hypothetical protein [Chlamydiota bacterium]
MSTPPTNNIISDNQLIKSALENPKKVLEVALRFFDAVLCLPITVFCTIRKHFFDITLSLCILLFIRSFLNKRIANLFSHALFVLIFALNYFVHGFKVRFIRISDLLPLFSSNEFVNRFRDTIKQLGFKIGIQEDLHDAFVKMIEQCKLQECQQPLKEYRPISRTENKIIEQPKNGSDRRIYSQPNDLIEWALFINGEKFFYTNEISGHLEKIYKDKEKIESFLIKYENNEDLRAWFGSKHNKIEELKKELKSLGIDCSYEKKCMLKEGMASLNTGEFNKWSEEDLRNLANNLTKQNKGRNFIFSKENQEQNASSLFFKRSSVESFKDDIKENKRVLCDTQSHSFIDPYPFKKKELASLIDSLKDIFTENSGIACIKTGGQYGGHYFMLLMNKGNYWEYNHTMKEVHDISLPEHTSSITIQKIDGNNFEKSFRILQGINDW